VVHARNYDGRVLNLEMDALVGQGNLKESASKFTWIQESGLGHQGQKPLEELPSVERTWKEWRTAHPDSELSLTPATLGEPVESARITAEIFSFSGMVSLYGTIGYRLIQPVAVILMASVLFSIAVIKRRRDQAVRSRKPDSMEPSPLG